MRTTIITEQMVPQMEDDYDNGPEDGSQPPRVEIRITVPSCGRSLVLVNYELRMQLSAAGGVFDEDRSLPLVPSAQAMYEEEILEAVIPIRYGEPYHTVRDSSISLARNWCGTVGHGLHEAVRLEFLSPDSFYLWCKPSHFDVPIAGFSFGSFRNVGVFDDHFHVVSSPRPIVIDFEHDSKRMDLYCMYQMEQQDFPPQRSNYRGGRQNHQQKTGIRVYRMTYAYSAIHSIVVDYSGDYGDASSAVDGANREATVLYFRLKNPPKIEAAWGRCPPPRQINNMNLYDACMTKRREPYYRRQRQLPGFSAEQIGKCNVLKIILKPCNPNASNQQPDQGLTGLSEIEWHEAVNEILSRIKKRSSCGVFYTGVRTKPAGNSEITISENYLSSFKCYYLLHALICTRMYNIADQVNNVFLNYVRCCVVQNENAAELALSQLLAAADENRYFSLMNAFRKVFEVYVNEQATMATMNHGPGSPPSKQAKRTNTVSSIPYGDEEVSKNCVKVRKLVVTPTREMLLAPEVICSNRVLRRFGEEYALRVVIRDENGQKLQGARMEHEVFGAWMNRLMTSEYIVGPRRYRFLGWSNSQLRDHAFYMYATTSDGSDIRAIRHWMGDFTAIQNVPKLMSRMGQCFTQAQTSMEIPWNSGLIGEEEDIVGGDPDPNTGELYTFSDGIGRMSKKCAEEVCRMLDVTPLRSAYQIRYAGFKGMLSVDPNLDNDPNGKRVMLRKSMHKFESDTSCMLEIVKYSQPSPVYLNRPLVMILDQVSEKPLRPRRNRAAASAGASENVHRRVCNRIHELLDDELFNMADMLLDEKASVTALTTRTTLSIDCKRLKEAGFKLTTEPFFRGMLLAIHQYTIKQQLWKQKIEVPLEKGRTMYGVLDTTKLLQYGQVFVQYSKDLSKPGEQLQVVEGEVMVTKNPCIVPGDVRIFKAVNVPALAHMFDVIVFPQNGPRPHTDEMAGSDLDGDEYSVYWDLELMFDPLQVQEPMHFPKNKPRDVEGGVTDTEMVEFFGRYLQQDSIGKVSYAHLAFADREGLFSKRAMDIAVKCAMAVDFPKTGVPAEPLTEDEQPYKWPDFFEKYYRPMYRSQRLVGKLYRRVKNASDIIRLGQDSISRPTWTRYYCDSHLEVPGWEVYKEDAIACSNQYVQYLQLLLDQYGVSDEASLISGHMVTIRNRLSDGEKEDFSFFNTEKIIEFRITRIFQKFRQRFFDEFGGERDELLEQPDELIQQKASAWYMVTYGQQQTMRGRIMLSFPWIVWEILRYIKLKRTFELYSRQMEERVVDPTAEMLTATIEEYCVRCEENVARLINIVIAVESSDGSDGVVSFYTKVYNPDFTNLLAVVLHWAEKEIGFERENSLKPIYIARLLVEFCLTRQYLERRSALVDSEQSATAKRLVSKGDILLEFLKYLASFKHQESLTAKICNDEATISLRRKQMWLIGQVAFRTYHHVAWTNSFDSLRLQNTSRMAKAALDYDREETEAITVVFDYSVTRQFSEEQVEKLLKQWSGVHDVRIRMKPKGDGYEYLVTGAGKLEACHALHDILLSENLVDCILDNRNPLLDQEY